MQCEKQTYEESMGFQPYDWEHVISVAPFPADDLITFYQSLCAYKFGSHVGPSNFTCGSEESLRYTNWEWTFPRHARRFYVVVTIALVGRGSMGVNVCRSTHVSGC